MGTQSPPPTSSPVEDRLDSWKEIASFLKRDVRTVQRWEKREGLPVHRHLHDKLGSVYAFKSEIQQWWASRQASLPEESTAGAGDAVEETSEPEVEQRTDTPVDTPATQGGPAPTRRTPKFWIVLVFAFAVIGLIASVLFVMRRIAPRPKLAVTVIPFENLSGDPQQEYFSAGLTEELVTQLGRANPGQMTVIAANPGWLERVGRDPLKIAREAHADYLLQGSVRRQENRVRITAQLVRASDRAQVFDEGYDGDLNDILGLQERVAEEVARAVSVQVTPASRSARRHDPRAYDAYLQGRFYWNKRTPADLLQAIHRFEAATLIDPKYAEAYAGIADCYVLLGSAQMGTMPPKQAMPRAKAAVEKALALDDGLAEAHASRAHIALVYDWNWELAAREFQRAIALNPTYATAHQWYALYYNAMGKHEEALAELRRAQELDPLSPTIRVATAEAYYFARDYAKCVEESQAALQLDPNFLLAYLTLGRALGQQGHWPEAIAAFEKGQSLSGGALVMTTYVAWANAGAGQRAEAQAALSELTGAETRRSPGGASAYIPALYPAAITAGLGDKDATLSWLNQAVDERSEYLIYLRDEPLADFLRSDPRFTALLKRVGLSSQADR